MQPTTPGRTPEPTPGSTTATCPEAASDAFGAPGIAPAWAAGDKDTILSALGTSRLWVTIGGGVLNEVFWPTTGRPQLRDLGFLVSGDDFWTEVKREADYEVSLPAPGIPLPTIVHHHDRFTLTLRVVVDPHRDVVLVRYRLDERDHPDASPGSLRLHVLAAPHLGGSGHRNRAWCEHGGLYASNDDESLALLDDAGFSWTSAGFVGASDGWQDLQQHGRVTWRFDRATDGNVALLGTTPDHEGVIALAFATTATGARSLARASLTEGFDNHAASYAEAWQRWNETLRLGTVDPELDALAQTSAAVLRMHEDATFPGAIVASLSTPWGTSHDDPGGYHLVWPRDCAETGLALSAIGLLDDARRVLHHLAATQEPDGHWPQNFSPDGVPYWSGLQLDEAALPVVLCVKLHEMGALRDSDLAPMRQMVRRAVRYVALHGPSTDQDRWEETAGVNPFTMAVAIAALVGAATAGLLDADEADEATRIADWWWSRIDELLYARGGALATQRGLPGNYVRVTPRGADPSTARLMLANRNGETVAVADLVGLEFLALVRHGLRRADDPRIVDTVALIDDVLRVELPGGPYYYRYPDDGYGEHVDGSPFDGSGIGRAWPLLAGERGHYAIDAGESAMEYLRAMAASTSRGHLIPEQLWDADDVPARRLQRGKPTGSAMPLVWAHAEFLKLHRATATGVPHDRIDAVAARYANGITASVAHIRDELHVATDAAIIAIEWDRPFLAHVGVDGWHATQDETSQPSPLGIHQVRVARDALGSARSLEFTRYDLRADAWEGVDHRIDLLPT